MQLVWAERSTPITGGFLLSVLFHVLLALLIILGLPSFFQPEVLPQPEGIEATIVSDITAAPKVDKQGKQQDLPKPPTPPAPEQKKPEPPKPAPPVTPAPAASAPAPAEAPVAIPDETKKQPDQKKPDDKPKPDEKKPDKKPEEKPKPDTQQQDFNALLKNLTKQQPAPETQDKPKPKAQPAPAQPTVGQQASLTNDVPITASEEDTIRAQVEHNWNWDPGAENFQDMLVELRVSLQPDGTVTDVQILNSQDVAGFGAFADSAKRAVEISSPLKLPSGKYWPTIVLRFKPEDAIQ
ncbi:MAG TPA: TonB C-terminal domain-containing protein [Candidatus Cybelea sp.]|nr:TonB C-terminal domain-containing protein [Candidatus Cybelea sp.]